MNKNNSKTGSTGLVLLFSTTAAPERAARLHAADCNMVNTAGSKVKAMSFANDLDPELVEALSDLEERGFPVKRCKCCPL